METSKHIRRRAATVAAASALCCAASAQGAAATANTAEALAAKNLALRTLACEVRREIETPDGASVRVLSRVSFERPNKLRVETASPERRRVVCDGAAVHTQKGAGAWVRTPFAELPEARKAELRRIPGTADDELSLFAGMAEKALPPAENLPKRVGYEMAGGGFAVLSLDAQGRLARMEVFKDAAMTEAVSRTDFSSFAEVAPGVWLARLHVAEVRLPGGTVFTTTRIGNITVNEEPPAGAFDAPEGAAAGRGADMDFDALGGARAMAYAAAGRGGARGLLAKAFMAPARAVIGFYRAQISPAIGARCGVLPSCSEYFMQAARRHGPLALPMIADRLVREPDIHAKGRAVRVARGRVLRADPLADHDWWFH